MSHVFRSLGSNLHRERCRLAGEWAARYAAMGLNPLPSRGDAKRPALGTYKRWLEERIPHEWVLDWRWPNIQLPMGPRWGICCIDLDRRPALQRWNEWCAEAAGLGISFAGAWHSAAPRLCRDGFSDFSDSLHVFFRWPVLPDGMPGGRLGTTILWREGTSEGAPEIRFIGQGGLVVVPPSIHPERKTAYEWLRFSEIGLAVLPEWLLQKVLASRPAPAPIKPRPAPGMRPDGLPYYRSEEVLAVLGDRKVEIAISYGLRVVRGGDPYVKCRAADRDDANPSCSMDRRTGRYFDWARNESCSFFELLALLNPGTFPDWKAARDRMGLAYLGVNRCRK